MHSARLEYDLYKRIKDFENFISNRKFSLLIETFYATPKSVRTLKIFTFEKFELSRLGL